MLPKESNTGFVVVRFWISSISWHVSHHIRSVSGEQQTQYTSWLIMTPRRKPRALLRVHTRSDEKTLGLAPSRNLQLPSPSPTSATVTFLSDYIYPGSFIWIFNLGEIISLVGGSDPHRKALHRDSRLYVGYNSAAGFSDSHSQLHC